MGNFEEYLDKKEEKKLSVIYTGEEHKSLEETKDEQMPKDIEEFRRMYEERLQETSSFENRTKYYFEDAKLTASKGKRYRKIASDEKALKAYSTAYSNYSTSKRRDYATKAADAFDDAAKLEYKHQREVKHSGKPEKKDFALYKHREKVIRLRMEGMINAAKLKSRSETDEKYRVLKAQYSCLNVLKDQLNVISGFALDPKVKEKFEIEREKLENEIEKVEKDLSLILPSAYRRWEEDHGIVKRPDSDNFDEILNAVMKENAIGQKELTQLQNGAKKSKIFGDDADYEDVNKVYRFVSHPCYVVKRDKQGFPIDDVEMKKWRWNKKWKDAIKKGDVDTKNEMLKQSYTRLLKYDFPTPEQIKKRGIRHFFTKNPSSFMEVIRLGGSYDELAEVDDYAGQIVAQNTKLKYAVIMAKSLFDMFQHNSSVSQYAKFYESFTEYDSFHPEEKEHIKEPDMTRVFKRAVADPEQTVQDDEQEVKEVQENKEQVVEEKTEEKVVEKEEEKVEEKAVEKPQVEEDSNEETPVMKPLNTTKHYQMEPTRGYEETDELYPEDVEKSDYEEKVMEYEKDGIKVKVRELEKKTEKQSEKQVAKQEEINTDAIGTEHLPNFKYSIQPEIKYERQGTRNCFACSGTALLNQFIYIENKKTGKKLDPKKQFGQLDLRDYKISGFKTYEQVKDLVSDEAEYQATLNDIKSRIGVKSTAVNNILELGDFFLDNQKDICVNRMVFKMPAYVEHMEPERIKAFDEQRHRLKTIFLDKVNEVLNTDNFVSVLHNGHYLTITGINGDKLEVLESIKSSNDKRDVTKPITKTVSELMESFDKDGIYDNHGNISEITWLSKVDSRKLTSEFENLQYNDKEGFSLKEHSMDEALYLGQTKGVLASREEYDSELAGGGVIYNVYVPKMDEQSRNAPEKEVKPTYGQLDYKTVMNKMGQKINEPGKIDNDEIGIEMSPSELRLQQYYMRMYEAKNKK